MHKTLLALIITLALSTTNAIAQAPFPSPPPPAPDAHQSSPHRRHTLHSDATSKALPNVLTVNMTGGILGEYSAASMGVEYERFINRKGSLSITMPVMLYRGGTIGIGEFNFDNVHHQTSGMYAAPGFSYHPFGNKRHIDLGIGVGMGIGSYRERMRYVHNYNSEQDTYEDETITAPLLRISMNIHLRSGFLFGVHASAGPVFSNGIANSGILQIGVKLGGCF